MSDVLAGVWQALGLPAGALSAVRLTGADPVQPSSFRIGAAAQATIAAAGLAAAVFHRQRGGRAQTVAVDIAHAAAEFRSERHLRVDGGAAPELWDPIAGLYACADGFVRLHTNFRHHRDGVVALLGCADEKPAVAEALRGWTAEDFETEATKRGMVVAAARDFATWDRHLQSSAVAGDPLVAIQRIGPGAPRRRPTGVRPLSGIRILDLTRIIAGPVAGRTLAAHGADVLRLIAPDLPTIAVADIDTGRGKRSAFVDLKTEEGRATLWRLIGEADVLLQSYRPGALAALGFSEEAVAAAAPGIVMVSLSAYGTGGPWGGKRGFDSLVQTATGFNVAEARAAGGDQPRPLPCQALDHGSGYLLAAGTIAALMRQADEGGSYAVRVTLARTAHWLRGLGTVPGGIAHADPGDAGAAPFLEEVASGYGRLTTVSHAARLGETPAGWSLPSVPYGTDSAAWLPRD